MSSLMERTSESGTSSRVPKSLLLIPSVAKTGIEQEVSENRHPTMDYYALQSALNADCVDYRALESATHPLVKLALKAGKDVGLAAYGFVKRRDYEVIYSNGENVSIPLAAMLLFGGRRAKHILIGHHLSRKKKKAFLKALHGQMDAVFVYAATQRDYALNTLGIPANKLKLIPFHADHRFYAPREVAPENMICSAGLEWRDYPTLIEAVKGLDIEVKLAAASPWSKHKNETENRELPPNVSARRYSYEELRNLYAAARFVVVPLYDNDFQAGVTTLLEAMSMGKAVIVTQTVGQRDVIQSGLNGIYVPPNDPAALRAAIVRLLNDPEEATRLGNEARKTIQAGMTLDHWAQTIRDVATSVARTN